MKYLLMICILCVTISCQNKADVAPPPEDITLTAADLVVILEVRVENEQWSIQAQEVRRGTPTASIVQTRDILIGYSGQEGKMLGSVSIRDPRIIIEEEPPDFSNVIIRPSASTRVAIPYLPALQVVSLRGQTTRLKSLEKSFEVGAQVKALYSKFEAASE